ncbi:MAG: O-antigen ligase family protein [Candidatus Eremiobacteraeota bacterium]|nr:O-antigen ligase family protein [Candidatus Eremiobacteraeota bacterium]
MNRIAALVLATFFVLVQLYTSLAALSPTPPVGYLFLSRATAAAAVALLGISATVGIVLALRERAAGRTGSRWIVLPWIGASALSALAGLDPRSGLEVVGCMLMAAGFHAALVRWYRRPPVARAVLGAYLCFGLFAAVAALAMVAVRRPLMLSELNHGRAAGFFVTANQFAAFLLLCGFVAFGVAQAGRGWLRPLGWATTVASAAALIATFSRSGWIGAIAGALFLAIAHRRWLPAAGIAAFAAAGAMLLLTVPVARHDPADAFNRIAVALAGLRAAELFPMTGTGPMAYWRVYPSLRPIDGAPPGTFGALHPHNAYLSLAGELGLVGLVAVFAGWWAFGRAVTARLRAASATPARERRQLGLAVCAGLAAALVQGLFDTIGVVQMAFVWIPYTALALAAARDGLGEPNVMRCRLAVLLALAACSAPPPAPHASSPPSPATAAPVPIKIRGHGVPGDPGSKYIYLTEQKKNRIVYALRADSNTSIRTSQGNGRSDFVRPHVIFHATVARTLTADAPHATVLERDKSVLMTGGVLTHSNDGMTLTSDTLRYDDARETLHGEGHVTISTAAGERLTGNYFDYDLRTTEMHVTP